MDRGNKNGIDKKGDACNFMLLTQYIFCVKVNYLQHYFQ